jgi:cytochrome c-type biogenesis protein CcmH/NrfG
MHQLLAHEEIKEGNTNGAVVQFRKAMAIDPHLPDIHYELAELLNSSSTASIKNDAEKEYYAALLANPLNEKAECRLGEIDAKRGNATKAVEEFSKAVELRPADADAKVDLAKELMVLEQPDKALALLEEAIQLEPTNETAHYRLAMIYRTKKRTEDYKHELQVYQELKDAKEKLRATYKELLIQPSEISNDEQNEK